MCIRWRIACYSKRLVVGVVINQLLKEISGVVDRVSVAILSLIPANSEENCNYIVIVFYSPATEGITTVRPDRDDLINPAFRLIRDKDR